MDLLTEAKSQERSTAAPCRTCELVKNHGDEIAREVEIDGVLVHKSAEEVIRLAVANSGAAATLRSLAKQWPDEVPRDSAFRTHLRDRHGVST